jgi:von Willebrand factor type A domain/Aerotolerance regulator N-terminal
MSFLAPMLLAGVAAVGLPIALHFLFKAWYRPLPWAAMDFLRKSLEQTTRRIKFRELILLLLRCACLLLLAVALARPIIGWLAGTGENESIDAILVIDTSYSMGAKDGNSTRFDKAKAEALAVIDELPNNSTVQVISCSDRATVHKFTPSNLDQARNVVRGLTLTSQASDLGPGLTEAEGALDRVQGANKEIHIFSDFQRNAMEGGAAAKMNDMKPRARLILTRCADPSVAQQLKNVSVLDIKFPDSIPPHAGTRLPFTVILKNTGKVPVLNVAVTLSVDGQNKQNEQLIDTGLAPEIAPGATFPVTMTASLPRAGFRLLTATVGVPKTDGVNQATVNQPDDIPGDNRFDKLVLVRQAIRVLIVDGRPDPREPKDGSAHFVKNAIVPVSAGQKDEYFLRATTITTEQLVNEKLSDYQIVVLANVPANAEDKNGIASLEKKLIEQLKQFVTNGGGLIIGAGDFVLPESYNRELADLLPFALDKPIKAKPEAPFHPSPDRIENPSFLTRMRSEPFSTTFAEVDVATVLPAREQPGDTGRVIARLDNNAVLVSSRIVGLGEVVFIHTSLDTTWTNWPSKATAYVGSVLFTLTHLSGKADIGGNVVSGAKLTWVPKESARDYEVQKPDGTRSKLPAATALEATGKPTLVIADTSVAGEYQIQVQGLNDEEAAKFAVVPDLRESELLETMNDGDVAAKVGFTPFFRQAGMKNDLVESIRNQREWTVPVLVALLLFVLVEGAWAWYCGRAV